MVKVQKPAGGNMNLDARELAEETGISTAEAIAVVKNVRNKARSNKKVNSSRLDVDVRGDNIVVKAAGRIVSTTPTVDSMVNGSSPLSGLSIQELFWVLVKRLQEHGVI
jgi:hypothetical protein